MLNLSHGAGGCNRTSFQSLKSSSQLVANTGSLFAWGSPRPRVRKLQHFIIGGFPGKTRDWSPHLALGINREQRKGQRQSASCSLWSDRHRRQPTTHQRLQIPQQRTENERQTPGSHFLGSRIRLHAPPRRCFQLCAQMPLLQPGEQGASPQRDRFPDHPEGLPLLFHSNHTCNKFERCGNGGVP